MIRGVFGLMYALRSLEWVWGQLICTERPIRAFSF